MHFAVKVNEAIKGNATMKKNMKESTILQINHCQIAINRGVMTVIQIKRVADHV